MRWSRRARRAGGARRRRRHWRAVVLAMAACRRCRCGCHHPDARHEGPGLVPRRAEHRPPGPWRDVVGAAARARWPTSLRRPETATERAHDRDARRPRRVAPGRRASASGGCSWCRRRRLCDDRIARAAAPRDRTLRRRRARLVAALAAAAAEPRALARQTGRAGPATRSERSSRRRRSSPRDPGHRRPGDGRDRRRVRSRR